MHRLGEVAEGIVLEGLDGIAVMSRHKNDLRHRIRICEKRQEVKSIIRRHPDIKEDDINPHAEDQGERGLHVMSLPDNHDLGKGLQLLLEITAEEFLVIDHDGSDRGGFSPEGG